MIYLDYSATTKPSKKVLNVFNKVAINNYANANSNYDIAYASKNIIEKSINIIKNSLKLNDKDIIFTSGASEANNTVIKGLSQLTKKRHIITTFFEHSSVLAPISYLQTKGFKVDFVACLEDGRVDIENLKSLINEDTFLVSICAVNSEIGIRNQIEEIGLILKGYEDIYFHSDITQCLGKNNIDLTNIDFATCSAHKIYGIKGIGALIKKENNKLMPLINGGKSTTIYRSGTPQTALIASFAEAIKNIQIEDFNYVKNLNEYLQNKLKKIKGVCINSNNKCIPHILNISINGINSNITQKYLNNKQIYISTKTACATDNNKSLSVYKLTNDEEKSISSIRISLSHQTTKKEINTLLIALKELINENN